MMKMIWIGSCVGISLIFWIVYLVIGLSQNKETSIFDLSLQLFIPLATAIGFGTLCGKLFSEQIPKSSPYISGLVLVFVYTCFDLIARNLVIRFREPLPFGQALGLSFMAPFFSLLTIGIFLVPAAIGTGFFIGYLFSRASS